MTTVFPLPRELLATTFDFLDLRSRLVAACQVNKEFNDAMRHGAAWEHLSFEQFPHLEDSHVESVVRCWLSKTPPRSLAHMVIDRLSGSSMQLLAHLANIRRIDMRCNDRDHPAGPPQGALQLLLSSQEHLEQLSIGGSGRLTGFDISHNTRLVQLTVEDCHQLVLITGFSPQHKLSSMSISRCPALEEMPDLEQLGHSLCDLSVDGSSGHVPFVLFGPHPHTPFTLPPAPLLSSFVVLQRLRLVYHVQISDQHMHAICNIRTLTELAVSIPQVSGAAFSDVCQLTALRSLELYRSTIIRDTDMRCLSSLCQLERLAIGGFSNITNSCYITLSRISSLWRLTFMACERMNMRGVELCQQIRGLGIITGRIAHLPPLDEEDIHSIANLPNLVNLMVVATLPEHGDAISRLLSLHGLEKLIIESSTQVDSSMLSGIGALSALRTLRLPRLSDQAIVLRQLEQLTNLERLVVRGPVTEAEKSRMWTMLPQLRVITVIGPPTNIYFRRDADGHELVESAADIQARRDSLAPF